MAHEPSQLAHGKTVYSKVGRSHTDDHGGSREESDRESSGRWSPLVRGIRAGKATRAWCARRADGGARAIGQFRVSFVVRPFKWIRSFTIVAFCIAFLVIPTYISHAADQIVHEPSISELAKRTKLLQIENELLPRMTKSEPHEVKQISIAILHECEKSGIDPLFILAIIESESNFDPEAVSPTGARGLMQVIPSTFKMMSDAKRMFDPVENVRAGIRYVKHLYDSGFGKRGGPESILLAYNMGPGAALAVFKGEQERSYEAETYIPKVMTIYRTLLTKYGKDPRDAKKLFLAMR